MDPIYLLWDQPKLEEKARRSERASWHGRFCHSAYLRFATACRILDAQLLFKKTIAIENAPSDIYYGHRNKREREQAIL